MELRARDCSVAAEVSGQAFQAGFCVLLEELDYTFTNDHGYKKGSARNYFKVLESLCEGTLRSGLNSEKSMSVSDCRYVHCDVWKADEECRASRKAVG